MKGTFPDEYTACELAPDGLPVLPVPPCHCGVCDRLDGEDRGASHRLRRVRRRGPLFSIGEVMVVLFALGLVSVAVLLFTFGLGEMVRRIVP